MENFGVRPDVYADSLPEDFVERRDAQIERAAEVLKTKRAAQKR